MTISASLLDTNNFLDNLAIIFKFYDKDNVTIFYEIEFRVKLKNEKLVMALAEVQQFITGAFVEVGEAIENSKTELLILISATIIICLVAQIVAGVPLL